MQMICNVLIYIYIYIYIYILTPIHIHRCVSERLCVYYVTHKIKCL